MKVSPIPEVSSLPASEARFDVLHVVLGNGNDLVDGIADGDGFEVMGAVVLDELQQGVAVADLDLGGRLPGLRVQFDVSGHGLGAFVSEDLDENVAVFTTVEGRGAEAEILGGSGQSPTSGKQLVRLFHSVSLEVFEVSLHQLLQIVSQINLQKKSGEKTSFLYFINLRCISLECLFS